MAERSSLEAGFEASLFASRWIMAPMYIGLVVTLALLTIVFLRELVVYVPNFLEISADDTILVVLTLIDLTLAGNLLLIVIFSGYENFVSKLDVEGDERLYWMGNVDFAGLKMKIIGSIVAISAIHLLKKFMEIGKKPGELSLDEPQLFWLVVIHATFVLSGVLMALMDWLAAATRKGKH